MFEGLLAAVGMEQRGAEIVMDLGIIGIEFQGLLENDRGPPVGILVCHKALPRLLCAIQEFGSFSTVAVYSVISSEYCALCRQVRNRQNSHDRGGQFGCRPMCRALQTAMPQAETGREQGDHGDNRDVLIMVRPPENSA